ncbi:outer membrane beta-barrel protein [uncultured Duncaniella sp.]|uniref:outer membrane beta-barrel protein n=1 Tax=uncultured Duncaniella sp. TaxID=2768039 RepID=UPI00262AE7FC|nr:outer membrane beta-barrel protein [uncultured Duncaniella sp.]
MRRQLISLLIIISAIFTAMAEQPIFADHNRTEKFLDIDIHALAGGSIITENYMSCYPEISDINTRMGPACGIGVGARFNLREFLGLGTELNFTRNSGETDMAVSGSNSHNVSRVFQTNNYYKLDFPVYVSFIFNISGSVKWNVDTGMYYSYGTGGTQKNSIHDTKANNIGQLVMSVSDLESGFYNDHSGFINSYHRSDMGFHLATGITLGRHMRIGARTQIGLSNIANSTGIVKPTCRTLNFLGTIGWQF